MKVRTLLCCALLLAACTNDRRLAPSEDTDTSAGPSAEQNSLDSSRSALFADRSATVRATTDFLSRGSAIPDVWDLLRIDPRQFGSGLDPTKHHRLVGERGEVILIPANSMLRPDGGPAKGPVKITWAFAAIPMDFVMMRAPTVSDDALLGSGGSFYLEATENGTPLRIADGLDWTVRMPADPVTLFPKEGMRYFKGVRGLNNDVEWSIVPEERVEVEPITYKYFALAQGQMPGRPSFARIDSIARQHPERNNVVHAPSGELAVDRDKAVIARKILAFHDDPRYVGTYVCSLPFAERLALLTKGIFGQVRSSGNTHHIDERGANAHIVEALDVYAAHAGEDLYIADALVKQKLDRLDAIIGTTPGVTGIHIKELRAAYLIYAEQHLGSPVVIDDRGIALDAPDAFEQLVAGGLSLREADKLLTDHTDRKASLGDLLRVTPRTDERGTVSDPEPFRLKDGRMAVVRKRTVNTLRFASFGYVNCDRFLRQDVSSQVDVFVTLEEAPLNNEDVQILFPSINGCINLQRDPQMHAYRLPPRFFGLPLGLAAHVLVTGERDGVFHCELRKVTVDRKMNVRLSPRPSTLGELCERVKAATNGS